MESLRSRRQLFWCLLTRAVGSPGGRRPSVGVRLACDTGGLGVARCYPIDLPRRRVITTNPSQRTRQFVSCLSRAPTGHYLLVH